MEHRWNLRLPVTKDVTVHSPEWGRIRGRTRDISFEGMNIELPDARPIGVISNKSVQIEMVLPSEAGEQRFLLPAVIIRSDADSIGVMLADYGDAVFNALARLLGTEDVETP